MLLLLLAGWLPAGLRRDLRQRLHAGLQLAVIVAADAAAAMTHSLNHYFRV